MKNNDWANICFVKHFVQNGVKCAKLFAFADIEISKTENLNDCANDLNKSWVIGRLGTIFSISMAMACASNIPMMMGKRRFPRSSPNTNANDPDCD